MTKSNLLKLSALSLLVAAGFTQACGSTKQVWVADPDDSAGASSAGKAGGKSSAGESSTAGESENEGGSAGAEEQGGEAGEGGTSDVGGTSGVAGTGAGMGLRRFTCFMSCSRRWLSYLSRQ